MSNLSKEAQPTMDRIIDAYHRDNQLADHGLVVALLLSAATEEIQLDHGPSSPMGSVLDCKDQSD